MSEESPEYADMFIFSSDPLSNPSWFSLGSQVINNSYSVSEIYNHIINQPISLNILFQQTEFEISEDELTCPICITHKTYDECVMLNCSHKFCAECMHSNINHCKEKREMTLSCPLCRANITTISASNLAGFK